MGSLFKVGDSWIYEFSLGMDARKPLRIGRVEEGAAKTIRSMIDDLISHKTLGSSLSPATAAWAATVSDPLRSRLIKRGLANPATRPAATVANIQVKKRGAISIDSVFEAFAEAHGDLKPNTLRNIQQAQRAVAMYFGGKRDANKIRRRSNKSKRKTAETWRIWLIKKYSRATVATHVKKTKQVFAWAKGRMLEVNPFRKLKGGKQTNVKRMFYVSTEVIQKAIEFSPDVEFRLIWALARFGGIRIPSEMLELRWSGIEWARDRMNVISPKTEHHEGMEQRVVPIFAQLKPYLLEAYEAAEPGSDFVISRHRSGFRYKAEEILRKAGIAQWTRLFTNLRASRQTDLVAEGFPLHVVCRWLGNSASVAVAHYLSIPEEYYGIAAGNVTAKSTVRLVVPNAEATKKNLIKLHKMTPLGGISALVPPRQLQAAHRFLQNLQRKAQRNLDQYDEVSLALIAHHIEKARASSGGAA